MATLFPGAIWLPIPVSPSRPRRRKGRAVIFHVAVSEADSLFGLFSQSPNDSHLYVRRDGTTEQYVDLDLEAYASMDANASTISVETQGGVTDPDGEPWTDAQLAALARIARWAHDTEGVPLAVMPDSLPASRGIGWHRLGIDPWRVPGGEVWSSSRGKVCPGAAKIAQVPSIVAAAISGAQPQEPDVQLSDKISFTRPDNGQVSTFTVAEWVAWTNYYAGQAAATLGPLVQTVAQQAAQIAALSSAVGQLPGGSIDMAAVAAAAEKGAADALAKTTVTLTPAPAPAAQ